MYLPSAAEYFKRGTIFITAITTLVLPTVEVLLVPGNIYRYGGINAFIYLARTVIVGLSGFIFSIVSSLYGYRMYKALKGRTTMIYAIAVIRC